MSYSLANNRSFNFFLCGVSFLSVALLVGVVFLASVINGSNVVEASIVDTDIGNNSGDVVVLIPPIFQDKIIEEPIIDEAMQSAIDVAYKLESERGLKLLGDNNMAVGPFQIWKIVVRDVNRILDLSSSGYFNEILGGRRFLYEDRWSLDRSCEIFWVYLEYYGTKYTKNTGKTPTVETYTRIWNGGEHGWKRDSTLHYWSKALELLELT